MLGWTALALMDRGLRIDTRTYHDVRNDIVHMYHSPDFTPL
jgi:hypothetical protein